MCILYPRCRPCKSDEIVCQVRGGRRGLPTAPAEGYGRGRGVGLPALAKTNPVTPSAFMVAVPAAPDLLPPMNVTAYVPLEP